MAGWIRSTRQPTEALKRGKCQVSLKSQLRGWSVFLHPVCHLDRVTGWCALSRGCACARGGLKTPGHSSVLIKAAGFMAQSGSNYRILSGSTIHLLFSTQVSSSRVRHSDTACREETPKHIAERELFFIVNCKEERIYVGNLHQVLRTNESRYLLRLVPAPFPLD